MAEGPAVYRPRHPERTPLYRVVHEYPDRYLGTYEERLESRHGPLRSVAPHAAEAFLECGRLQHGFARMRCPKCRGEHLLAISRQTRNFCPSCQAKRAALFAESPTAHILAPVPFERVTLTETGHVEVALCPRCQVQMVVASVISGPRRGGVCVCAARGIQPPVRQTSLMRVARVDLPG